MRTERWESSLTRPSCVLSLTGPSAPPSRGEVHVWLARDAVPPDGIEALLDQAERERVARYAAAADRTRFTVGCFLLRVAAGRYLGVPAEAIMVDRGCPNCGRPHGKPRYVAPAAARGLEVSVSHSGRVVAVAFARAPVGVDIEEFDRTLIPWDLTSLILSPDEQEEYYAVDRDPFRRFLVYWTRKEAATKAVGLGLSVPLDRVIVSAPEAPPVLHTWPVAEAPSSVNLRDLRLGPRVVGALALVGSLERLVLIDAASALALPLASTHGSET